MRVAVSYHYYSLFTRVLKQYYNILLFFVVSSCLQNLCIILSINIITNIVVIPPVFHCWMHTMITHNIVLPSLWHLCTHIPFCYSHLPLLSTNCCITPSSSLRWSTASPPATSVTIKLPAAPDHSAPRSWHERDFCLRNLPTSRSRGYRGTRLDRKRLAREVMLSRWPPPLRSSALVPGGHGDWPLARRTAHSRSSGVR